MNPELGQNWPIAAAGLSMLFAWKGPEWFAKLIDPSLRERAMLSSVIGLVITLLVAALAYLLLAGVTGSSIVGIVAAILVLFVGVPTGGFRRPPR